MTKGNDSSPARWDQFDPATVIEAMGPTDLPEAGERIRANVEHPTFPILHYRNVENGVELDVNEPGVAVGTAFFIHPNGLFLTAAHVVHGYPDRSPPLVIYVLCGNDCYRAPVMILANHPECDVAIGFARIPARSELSPPVIALGAGELAPSEAVVMHGYSCMQTKIVLSGDGSGCAMNFNPRYYPGEVLQHHPDGAAFARGSVYSISVECDGATDGGISGGPVIRVADSTCYGIYSRGSSGGMYVLATHVAPLLDWPIPFIGGKTLRELAASHPDVLLIR